MPDFFPAAAPTGTQRPPTPADGTPGTARTTGTGPLPDAVAVRQIQIPEAAPPLDDLANRPIPDAAPPLGDLANQLSTAAPEATRPSRTRLGRPGEAAGVAALACQQPAGDLAEPDGSVPAQSTSALAPAASRWPSQFAQVLTETLAGSRPPRQIVPWTTEQTRRRISQLGPLLQAAQRPRLRRVIVTSPVSGVLEMTIVVGIGPRVRAVAVRLERAEAPEREGSRAPLCRLGGRQPQQGRWYCTAVEAA
jgi:hypothetical protein